MNIIVNRIITFSFFLFVSSVCLAQKLPVWHKVHGADLRKINFTKYIKNNSTFSIVKSLDTVSIPEVTTILLIDREGKFFQELEFDTAAYTSNREQIIAGQRKQGRMLLGLVTLKGEAVIPMEYLQIRFYRDLFAVKNQEYDWALFDQKGNKLTNFVYTDMSFTEFGKIKIKNEHGAGVLNENGTILIEPLYGEVSQLTADSFSVREQDRWEYIDRHKQIHFTWNADSINTVSDSVFLFYAEGRVLIKDSTGKIIGLEQGYHAVEKFGNKIKITLGEYSGLIDAKGKEILPLKFYKIKQENAGYLLALGDEIRVLRYGDVVNKNKKRWSLYDSLGRKILTRQYKTIRSFSEGLAAVQNDENLWGFVDEKGNVVIEPSYRYAADFKNGYTLVKEQGARENDYRLIDRSERSFFTGKEAQLYYLGVICYRTCADSIREGEPETELHYGLPPSRYDRYIPAEDGYIRVKNGSYTGVLLPSGKEAVQAYQDTVYKASSDTFFLYKRKNGLIGYSDKYGNTAMYLTDRFEQVQPLQEGFSRFKKDGLYGFIDPYGNVHIAPKYTATGEFHDGMAAVFLKGKWGFIDKAENLNVQPYYKEVKHFRNGFAPVKNIKNKWSFIDKEGKPVNTTFYDEFVETKNEKYLVQKNKRWGITYSNGKEILSPKYEFIEELAPNILKVKKDGKYGVMDFQENIVLYYQYDDVIYDPYADRFFVKWKGSNRKIKL